MAFGVFAAAPFRRCLRGAAIVCLSFVALSPGLAQTRQTRTRIGDPTFTPTVIQTPAPGPGAVLVGDCDGSDSVEIAELVVAVNIVLEHLPLEQCLNLDANADAEATINELVLAVGNVFEQTHFLPCGDAIRIAAEQCDDGNRVGGDGCSAMCRIEGGPILDQVWVGPHPDCGGGQYELNLVVDGPIGQEFVPTLPSLTAISVHLRFGGSPSNPLRTGSAQLNLREGSIDGPIVATATAVITLPPSGSAWRRFDFVTPVAVAPERPYVIELSSNEDRFLWIAASGDPNCAEQSYARGARLFGDSRYTTDDYLFAVFASAEPGTGPIDQQWTGPEGVCNIQANEVGLDRGPLAQSFTPRSLEIGSIAVGLQVRTAETGPLTVNIRRGSPTGPLVAARSFPVTAPQHSGVTWFRFDFVPPRVVVPGTPYVIELADPQNRFAWIAQAGDSTAPECYRLEYPNGTAFVDGVPLAVGDFPFATFESPP